MLGTYLIRKLEKMSLVDEYSSPSTKSELDFFTVPPTQVVIKKGFWDEINPTNPVTNDGPYEFRIPADPHLIQLSKNYIYMLMKITNPPSATGQPSPAVSPINLIGKTFFKQVKLYLGSKLVFDSGDKYAYRSFMETELNYGTDAKHSHLQSALYTSEAGEKFDDADNEGFKERGKYFKDGNLVEVTAPLHIDLFMQDRYLLSGTDLRLELNRNSNDFVLQSPQGATNAVLEIVQMKLFVRKVEILDSVGLALEKTMHSFAAKYPIRRVMLTNLHIPSTSQSTPLNTLYSGQLPRRMIIACVDADAYRGNIKKSPFNFKCYSISEVRVISGGQTFPCHPMRLDFKNNRYIRAFDQLFEALDLAKDNKGNTISRKHFKEGQCFFGFDLTPDEDDSGHWDLIKEGATSIEISFSEKIPDSGIEVIIYSEFDNLIMIDKNRHVFNDYTA